MSHAAAPPPAVAETLLLRQDLPGLPGKELIVSRLRAEPGWLHGRHYHPGDGLARAVADSGSPGP